MEKEVVACSGGKHIGKKISKHLKTGYSELKVKKFPDEELNLRFKKELKGKKVILVQSFYDNINDKVLETLMAFYTAKDLGAKKVELFSLYFPYFRQDKRFNKGECISIQVISKLFKEFDKIYFVDPHLHRIKNLDEVFRNGKKLTSVGVIADYLKKMKIRDKVFVGPDVESEQWVKQVADRLGAESTTLKKERYGDRKVKIKFSGDVDVKGKKVIILDDIISTGHTMLETIKGVKKYKPKQIYCIAIHGIFADKKQLDQLKKTAKVISTNTIPTKASKIDISSLAKELNDKIGIMK